MKPLARRAILSGAVAVLGAAPAGIARAVDALSDSEFVGFAQSVNDFEIEAGRLALARSGNENVRGYAARTVADYTEAASRLAKARSEAGVSYAPVPSRRPDTATMLQQLGALEGPAFDTAYANAQLAVHSEADLQYGAYSASGQGGPLRRYAQQIFPKVKMHLEAASRLAAGR